MNFKGLSDAFGKLEKASENFAKRSSATSKQIEAELEREQTLLGRKKQILAQIEELYNKNNGKLGKDDTNSLRAFQQELQSTVRKIAKMKLEMGDLKGAAKEYEIAMVSLRNIGEKGEWGKGIKSLEREYKRLATTVQVTKEEMRALNAEAAANNEVRHEKTKHSKPSVDIGYEDSARARERVLQEEQKLRRAIEASQNSSSLRNGSDRERALAYEQAVNRKLSQLREKEARQQEALRESVLRYEQAVNSKLEKIETDRIAKKMAAEEKALNETIQIRLRLERLAEQQAAKEIATRERVLQEEQKIRNALQKEREKVLEEENTIRAKLAALESKNKGTSDDAKALRERERVLNEELKTRLALENIEKKAARTAVLEEEKRIRQEILNIKRAERGQVLLEEQQIRSMLDMRRKQEREEALMIERQTRNAIRAFQELQKAREKALTDKSKQEQAGYDKHLKEISAVIAQLNNLERKVNRHKGEDGLVYSPEAFKLDKIRLKEIAEDFKKLTSLDLKNVFNTKGLFEGVNVRDTQKLREEQQRLREEQKLLNQKAKLLKELANLENRVSARSNEGVYTAGKLASDRERLAILKNELKQVFSPEQMEAFRLPIQRIEEALKTASVLAKQNGYESFISAGMKEAQNNALRLYETFLMTGKAADKLRFNKAVEEYHQLNKLSQDFNKKLQNSNNILEKTINSLKSQGTWMLQTMATAAVIQLPSDLFNQYRELEQAMAGVIQVMPLLEHGFNTGKGAVDHAEAVRQVNQEIREFVNISSDYARSIQEVTEAGQLWGRGYGKSENADGLTKQEKDAKYKQLASQGMSEMDIKNTIKELDNEAKALNAVATTNELVRQSAILATVDNFSMTESVKGLEAVLAAYEMRARSSAEATLFAGRAVDIISKVAHTGQISAQDLVRGIEATGKAAQQAGISLEFLSAMIETGARNTGKGGAEIGNAIKALTVGIHSKKGVKELEKFGIAISKIGKDGKTHMRAVEDVILDISAALQTGSKNAEKMLLAISGGRYQYSRIAAILQDEGELMRMWMLASESSGFARQQLDVQMNTINSKMKQVEANLQGLMQTMMEGGVGDAIKSTLDSLNQLIKGLEKYSDVIDKIPKFVGFYALLRVIPLIMRKLSLLTASLRENGVAATGASAASKALSATASILGVKSEKVIAVKKTENAILEANTARQETNNASKVQGATASEALATAEGQSGRAAATSAAGHSAATVAINAEKTAAVAATGATRALTAAETMATLGMNLLIGYLVMTVYEMATTEKKAEELEVKLKDIASIKIDSSNAESLRDQAQAMEGEVASAERMNDCLGKAIDIMKRLTKELDSNTLSAEEAKKKQAELNDIKESWGRVMKQAAADTGVAIDQEKMSYEQQKEAFKAATEEKKRILKNYHEVMTAFYEHQLNCAEAGIEAYQHDLEAFDDWGSFQAEGLDTMGSIWANFFSFVTTGLRKLANELEYLGNKSFEMGEALEKALGVKNPLTFLLKAAGTSGKVGASALNSLAEASKWAGTVWIKKDLKTAMGDRRDALKNLHDLIATDVDFLSKLDFGNDNGDGTTGGEYEPPADKGKKGKNKKTKLYIGNYDTLSAIHDMTVRWKNLEQYGLTFEKLWGLAAIESGGKDPWGIGNGAKAQNGDHYGMFQVSSSLGDKYAKGYDLFDPSVNAFVAGSYLSELLARTGSLTAALKEYTGGDESTVQKYLDFMEQFENDIKNSYTIQADKNYLYNENSGKPDISKSLQAGIDAWLGKTMDLHGVGCVEAVERVGSYFSDFLKKEFEAGVRHIPTLMNDAIAAGIDVIPYDESKLELGDTIVWNNSGDKDNHVGIFTGYKNGTAMAVDNSSGADKIVERPVNRSWQQNQSIIKTGSGKANGLWSKNDDENKNKTLATLHMNPDEIKRAYAEEEQQRLQQRYSLREAEIKRDVARNGTTSANAAAYTELQVDKLNDGIRYLETMATFAKMNHDKLNNLLYNNKEIQEWLNKAGVQWHDLSKEQQKQLLEAYKNQKGEGAEQLIKLMENDQKFNYDKFGKSIVVDQLKGEVESAELEIMKSYGYKNPQEQYEYDLQRSKTKYEAQKRAINAQNGNNTYKLIDLEKAHMAEQVNITTARRLELERQIVEQEAIDAQRIQELAARIETYQKEIDELAKKKEAALSHNEDVTQIDMQMQSVNKQLKIANQELDAIKQNGSSDLQALQQTLDGVVKANDEAIEGLKRANQAVAQMKADFVYNALDDILIKGKSVQEVFANIAKDLASYALKHLVYNAFGIGNLGGGGGMIGGLGALLGGIFAEGGSLQGLATGGKIEGFDTGGQIRGAGTGTSDSILTYLGNKGKFIKTSDGEYIIKEKTVSKLGTGFFDMLNNHPEMFEGFRKYASGGSLGEEVSPSMSTNAVKSYKSYTTNKAAIKNNPNQNLERLMQEQTGVIKGMGQQDGGGKLVVLNTQADNATVLKALQQNPRALHAILGGQKKRGFR